MPFKLFAVNIEVELLVFKHTLFILRSVQALFLAP